METQPAGTPFLEMRGISKCFPGVQALDQIDFDLYPGEVHALVGENGAGKSTLMKVLSGVYQPDSGQIRVCGQVVQVRSPRAAQELGISIVHQELNLFQNLSIAENLFGGRMPRRGPLGFEDRAAAKALAAEYLHKFELPLDPFTPVRRLSLAQQQVIEISKALARQASVLILDEPTSSLTEHESELLFKIISQLKAAGLCIVYISHRLEEIFRIGDRVTVLRDGKPVGTQPIAQTSIDAIIRMMVGRKLEDLYGRPAGKPGDTALQVESLSSRGRFEDVSFSLRKGEILGMAGLVGAGRSDVGQAIFGALPVHSGALRLDGQAVRIATPNQAIGLGIAYLSENRQGDAIFGNMDVCRNITVSQLRELSRAGMLNPGKELAQAQAMIQRLNIATPSARQRIGKLSGGNQQKVILARWLALKLRVLIVDEPTRGIDVGAKMEIYALLHRLAAQGVGILLISSEMPEVLGMSDRILVMHEGRVTGELSRAEATEERVMALAAARQAA
ncbi:MAG: sugar ABC transporter ATP-binding protein [Chloroflexota bacterium]